MFAGYSNRLHEFSVTIQKCSKDVYINSFFPHTPRLVISFPIKCFSLTCDLRCVKFKVNGHLISFCSFDQLFLSFFILVTSCLAVVDLVPCSDFIPNPWLIVVVF